MARAALRPLQAEQGLQFADAVHDRGRFGGTELLGARRSPGDPDAPDTGRPGRSFPKKNFDKGPGEGRKFRQERDGKKGFHRGGKGR